MIPEKKREACIHLWQTLMIGCSPHPYICHLTLLAVHGDGGRFAVGERGNERCYLLEMGGRRRT